MMMTEGNKKVLIRSESSYGDSMFFNRLDGMFASNWCSKKEAQIFNSKETAECIIKELERRHKTAFFKYEIVELEEEVKTQ